MPIHEFYFQGTRDFQPLRTEIAAIIIMTRLMREQREGGGRGKGNRACERELRRREKSLSTEKRIILIISKTALTAYIQRPFRRGRCTAKAVFICSPRKKF